MSPPTAAIFLIAAAGLAVRLALAWATHGTSDVDSWLAFSKAVQAHGVLGIYPLTEWPGQPSFRFNHGPLAAWALGVLRPETAFAIRVPSIVGDFASTLLAGALVQGKQRNLVAALIAFNPALILLSGFHGNTDALLAALLLSVVVARKAGRPGLAGVAFAGALSVKVAPLILVPLALLGGGRSGRSRFVVFCAATLAVCWLPHLLATPGELIAQVLLYRPRTGVWGLSLLWPRDLPWPGELWTVLLLAAVWTLGGWWARSRRPPLEAGFAAVLLLFLTLSPGFGVQYLAWPIPLLAVARPRAALAYSLVAGAFLYATYAHWSGSLWIDVAPSWGVEPKWTPLGEALKQAVWLLTASLAALLVRDRCRAGSSANPDPTALPAPR